MTYDDLFKELSNISAREQAGEISHEEALSLVSKLPKDVLKQATNLALVPQAKKDTPEGFFAFYEILHGFAPPDHVKSEISEIFLAHEEGRGYSLNGWRGSWKSVSLSVTFQAWRIGLEPHKTNVTICANDDSAEKITKAIAAIIEYHPGWNLVFPNVVPDKGKWSVEGFWVLDTDLPREKWTEKQAGVIDPTFVGGGHGSTRVNGKHPTGCLIVDDLHDINNSSSDKERKIVTKTMTTVILKTAVRAKDKLSTWVLNVGVPWADDDSHHVLKKSGSFRTQTIPAMKRALEGDKEAVYLDGVNKNTGAVYDDIIGWWILTEPKRFGVNSIMSERSLGKAEFWQMIMMDIKTGKTGGLKYYPYPKDRIEKHWPTLAGVDPSFTLQDRQEHISKNSSFAMAVGSKIPGGNAVLRGGVLEQCNLNRAATHIMSAQSDYPNWLFSAVENVGMGLLFKETIRLINPNLILVTSDLGGIRQAGEKAGKAKNKKTRIETELAPWLENAVILISDDPDDKFLSAVKDGLENFHELDDQSADERLDALDAFYHMVKAMPDVLQRRVSREQLPSVRVKPKSKSPISGLSRHRGYGVAR